VRTRALLLVLFGWALGLSGVCAPVARADEPAAMPLARLSPAEQSAVRRKIPGVDALPREKQEQIVHNVEWLRSLDPERRALVLRRLQHAQDARVNGQKLDDRMDGLKELQLRKRESFAVQQGLVIRGLGRAAWRDLPAEIRGHPAVRGMGERAFAVAFHRKFWHRAFQGLDEQAARAFEPPADTPPELRKRVLEQRAQVQAGSDPKALWRLKEAVLQTRALEVVRAAGAESAPPAPGTAPARPHEDDGRLVSLGERLRDLARPAYDETLKDLERRWREKGPEAWVGMVTEAAQPVGPPPDVRRRLEALQVVLTVESWNGFLAQHPGLVPHADGLLEAALVKELGMSPEEFARLPPRGEGAAQEQRAEAFRQWLEQRPPLPREWLRRKWSAGFGAGASDRPGWFPGRARAPGARPAPGAPGAPPAGVPPEKTPRPN
jgi:hypothetical protein